MLLSNYKFLADSDSTINPQIQNSYTDDKNLIFRIFYNNNCALTREFMYGCCKPINIIDEEVDLKKYKFRVNRKHYNTDNLKDLNNINQIKTFNFLNDSDIYIGKLENKDNKPNFISISKLNDKKTKCLGYKNFRDKKLNYICPIDNGVSTFDLLNDYLYFIQKIINKKINFEFILSNDKVPKLQLFKETTSMEIFKTYNGDINNFSNLQHFISFTLQSDNFKDLLTKLNLSIPNDNSDKLFINELNDIVYKIYNLDANKKQKIKELQTIFNSNSLETFNKYFYNLTRNVVGKPCDLYIYEKNYKNRKDHIELTIKYNHNYLETRPDLILDNLLYNNEYKYVLILLEHEYLTENYVFSENVTKNDSLLYWCFWGFNIKKLSETNLDFTIPELDQDDEENTDSDIILKNKQLYRYLVFNKKQIQMISNNIKKINNDNVDKTLDVNFKIHLLNDQQKNDLDYIYDNLYNNDKSIFYQTFINKINEIKNINSYNKFNISNFETETKKIISITNPSSDKIKKIIVSINENIKKDMTILEPKILQGFKINNIEKILSITFKSGETLNISNDLDNIKYLGFSDKINIGNIEKTVDSRILIIKLNDNLNKLDKSEFSNLKDDQGNIFQYKLGNQDKFISKSKINTSELCYRLELDRFIPKTINKDTYVKISNVYQTPVDRNIKHYQELVEPLEIHYNVDGNFNRKLLNDFHTSPYKDYLFRVFTSPFLNYKLINDEKNIIKISDEGYYELYLLDNLNKFITLKINDKKYFINNNNNILYIPGKINKNSELEISYSNENINEFNICIKKSNYVINNFDNIENKDGNLVCDFQLSKPYKCDIVFHIKKENIDKQDSGFDNQKYKIYRIDKDSIIIILRHTNLRTTNVNFTIPIIKNKNEIFGSYILYHRVENTVMKYELNYIPNEITTLQKIYNENPYLRHKIIKNTYINLDNNKRQLISFNKNNLLSLVKDPDIKYVKIINDEIEFFNIGPNYNLTDDDLGIFKIKRIHNLNVDSFCMIRNNIPSIKLEMYKFDSNLKILSKLNFNSINHNLNKIKGLIKIFIRETSDILVYSRWNINLFDNQNNTNEIFLNPDYENINETNCYIKNTLIKNNKIEYVIKFYIYEEQAEKKLTNKNEVIQDLKDKQVKENFINELEKITDFNNINLFNKFTELFKKDKTEKFDFTLTYLMDKYFIENQYEKMNYTSYGSEYLKQDESKLIYNLKEFVCKEKEISIFNKSSYNNSFKEKTRNTSETLNNKNEQEKYIERQEEEKQEVIKEKTLGEVIDEYKKNIFNIYGDD